MRTPRDILLGRFQGAQAKLDAIRHATVRGMEENPSPGSPLSLRDVFRSLRWHLAGLSAIWLFVLLLHLDTGPTPQVTASIPRANIPSPQVILATLRENRRQLSEMTEPRPTENKPRDLLLPKPRSERRSETLTV